MQCCECFLAYCYTIMVDRTLLCGCQVAVRGFRQLLYECGCQDFMQKLRYSELFLEFCYVILSMFMVVARVFLRCSEWLTGCC